MQAKAYAADTSIAFAAANEISGFQRLLLEVEAVAAA